MRVTVGYGMYVLKCGVCMYNRATPRRYSLKTMNENCRIGSRLVTRSARRQEEASLGRYNMTGDVGYERITVHNKKLRYRESYIGMYVR